MKAPTTEARKIQVQKKKKGPVENLGMFGSERLIGQAGTAGLSC
jgi:hypothetical protein